MGIEDFARQVKEASIKLAALSGDQKQGAGADCQVFERPGG